jgi:hypothetical protein
VRNISDNIFYRKLKDILCSIIVFPKIVPFMNLEKYGTARQATDDNMTPARYVLDT